MGTDLKGAVLKYKDTNLRVGLHSLYSIPNVVQNPRLNLTSIRQHKWRYLTGLLKLTFPGFPDAGMLGTFSSTRATRMRSLWLGFGPKPRPDTE